jgi:hypothetical protein
MGIEYRRSDIRTETARLQLLIMLHSLSAQCSIQDERKTRDRMSRSASRLTGQNVRGLKHCPICDFDLRATHALTILPADLASVSFGFMLV